MQSYTLTISENTAKAIALLNYLKTIEFVKISKTTDWWDTLTEEQQNGINKSVEQLNNGEGVTYEDVRMHVNKLLAQPK